MLRLNKQKYQNNMLEITSNHLFLDKRESSTSHLPSHAITSWAEIVPRKINHQMKYLSDFLGKKKTQ